MLQIIDRSPTFISLYHQKAVIGVDTPLRSYLYLTLKRKIFNQYRSKLVHQRYELHVSHRRTELDDSTQITIETREPERLIEQEIEKLPPQCRQVFRLSRQGYLSNKEIAEQLNISENTVKQHIRRALSGLRASQDELLSTVVSLYIFSR